MEIPSEGTIRRCTHGVYWPKGDPIAYYCQLCNSIPLAEDARKFVMHRGAFNTNDRLRANKHEVYGCPACGSTIHVEVNRKTWECADCQTQFNAPKKRRFAESEAEVAA